MTKRLVRQESRITELEFGYSQLSEILNSALKGEK